MTVYWVFSKTVFDSIYNTSEYIHYKKIHTYIKSHIFLQEHVCAQNKNIKDKLIAYFSALKKVEHGHMDVHKKINLAWDRRNCEKY